MTTARRLAGRVTAATCLTVASLGAPLVTGLQAQGAGGLQFDTRGATTPDAALRRARTLLREVGLVDTHNDLPWVLRIDPTHPMDLTARDLRVRGSGDTDLPKLREGGVGTQFWSVYVPSDLSPVNAMRAQLEQIELTRRLIARYPRDLGLAASTAAIRRVRANRPPQPSKHSTEHPNGVILRRAPHTFSRTSIRRPWWTRCAVL